MISDFYPAYTDTNWNFPEELSGKVSTIEPTPSPTETQTSYKPPAFQPLYNNDIRPFDLDSTTSVGSSNYNPISQKITEYEVWDLPPPANLTKDGILQNLSPSTQPLFQRHKLTTSLIENSCDGRLIVKRANSTNDKPHGLLQSSNPSESRDMPKRRYSFAGEQKKSKAAWQTDEEANIGSIDKVSENKALARSSHSIVERKYRDNLNTRITELDQTLYDIRYPDRQSSKLDTNEHPQKMSKAEVLNEAMRYVRQAELDRKSRMKEIDFLRLRVTGLEKLVNCADCALLKRMSDQQISTGIDF